MKRLSTLSSLAHKNDKKILLWVFDGIGGRPHPDTGLTELETAKTPSLDAFSASAMLGRTLAHGHGITPGSGPGHLALFGYPNDQVTIGRGVLEVLGSSKVLKGGEPVSGFELVKGDVAARGNFSTRKEVDGRYVITDRRAGKPDTEVSGALVKMLSEQVKIDGVDVFLLPGKQHRFSVVFRGEGLDGDVSETDPQVTGVPALACEARSDAAGRSAEVINDFISQLNTILSDQPAANTALLRGIAGRPNVPTLPELFGLRCGSIAAYPMYRGISRLLGFEILGQPRTWQEEVDTLRENYDKYDLFYLHIKETDSVSHLGNFDEKVSIFEECDAVFAQALELGFDVVIVTGDHCTPSVLKEHSWDPIPTAMWYQHCLSDDVKKLTERGCARGTLGQIPARDLMPLALAASGKLLKYGA
jgi:2,3-bisphosphoglycerate-independent phosphoglycerate mutase